MGKRRILFLKAVAYNDLNPMIQSYLDRYRDENTELEVRSLKTGPKHLEYQYYQAIAGRGILEEVQRAEKDGFDAVIISCFDDPFLYPSREISQKIIVTAPGEASMHLAAMLGNQFSVIVGRDKWIPQMKENVHRYGLESKLASFRSLGMGVLEFHQDEEETVTRMKREIRSAIETDRAEVIILGCSMQFGFYEELQKEFHVPVIDSMVASLKHTEYLLEVQEQAGWRFSRRGLYERPPEEEMREWGLG
ncbi:Asp/Glu/hydantoin racemase [Lachnospiraceae bacterium]|uniref:aspartate/glutamate racemase family protein n=1 Tax=Extibacter sp. GGCC_0201 TaxID=2731209 RepID=UPI001AA0E2EF|nr:aspartate/glutamate racemase family protein [Extibacter sp. GGCC_0201]MBO1722226.1 hydantoin racemase [Extibacter sp. GGCC_0201]BDF35371.1 Asp/Glu/hydantoin racemase [Lachnospiraceae bacterium]BDF39373.1 Asp/Glu/hydantoin racemase [Lachnospiraceae bacterium]